MRSITFRLTSLLTLTALAADYPETRREAISNTYHGVTVANPYQWLEDWSSAEVKAWSAEQNKLARSQLDALPHREAIAKRVEAVISGDTTSYYSVQRIGDTAWFMK